MNDIEKAIEQLKHDKENFEALLKEYRPSTIKERVESIIKSHILAIQALEKQIPARIERSNTRAYGYCSECGKVFWDKWENEYCENCGQKLDWSEVENE